MTNRIFLAAFAVVALCFASTPASAQSNPGLRTGQVPTAAQWNSYFSAKVDYLGYVPLNPSNLIGVSPITVNNASGVVSIGFNAAAAGIVVGPASAVDNAIARFDGTTGKLIQNSLATLSDAGTLAISPTPLSSTQGLVISQTGPISGTTPGTSTTCTNAGGYTLVYNSICGDEASNVTGVSGTKTAVLLSVGMVTGGTNSDGSKVAFTAQVLHNQDSNITAGNDLQGSGFACVSSASQGGTNTGGGAKGTCFGTSSYGILQSGGLNHFLVSSGEFGAQIQAGASSRYRFAASFVDNSTLAAASLDAAIEIGSTTGSPGWKTAAVLLTDIHGQPALATTACLICYSGAAMTIANGYIASNITISGDFLLGPGSAFQVTGAGATKTTSLVVISGSVSGHVSPGSLFTNSLEVGAVSNHNTVFITNNTLAGYFDTGQKFNLGFAAISQGALVLRGLTAGTLEMAVPANFTAGRKITWPDGTTDFSATGGTSQVIKQITAGAAFTVARLACADLSDAGAGCNAIAIGTVTSVATTSPITGGTITSTGTIACATCVTSASALTANQIMIGSGSQASATLGSLGTTTTLLHGNAAGAPTFGAVVTADITNANVTYAKIQNIAGLSVFGRASNSAGAGADITSSGINSVLRADSSGTSIGFGAIDLAAAGTVASSVLGGVNGGSGVANTGTTLTRAGNITFAGAFATTVTATATTNSTLPAGTHTLAGLDVAQTFTADQTISGVSLIFTTAATVLSPISVFRFSNSLYFAGGAGGYTWINSALNANLLTITDAGVVQVTQTIDATSTSTGALTIPGGMSVNKRVFMNGLTASSGFQTAVICQSSAGELIADSVACLASSARFKENLEPMSDATALAEVMQLRPHTGRYKPEGLFTNQREHVWFIAEQVAEIDARLVGYDNGGLVRSVDYTGATVLNTGAIRALKADNDNLRAANDNLVTRVQELEARFR